MSPVQTELAGCSQDVDPTLSPQLLAQDGGGDEAASSPDSSTAGKILEGQKCMDLSADMNPSHLGG